MIDSFIQILIILSMKNAVWRGKKAMKQWETQKNFDSHLQRLKQMRPISCDLDWEPPTLNPNKKLRLQEDKYTQIQRQNKYLLQKIATTMRKKDKEYEKERMNRSLNAPFRKRQMQSIEVQNARMLRRLQQKKSDYDSHKLKEEWKKQKEVIKNVACYPFILKTSYRQPRKRVYSRQQQTISTKFSSLSGDIQMVRARTINNEQFVVTVRLEEDLLRIIGVQRKTKDKKVIAVPRQQAMGFIQEECGGRFEGIFQHLIFDSEQGILYLVGNGGDPTLLTIQQKKSNLQEEKVAEN